MRTAERLRAASLAAALSALAGLLGAPASADGGAASLVEKEFAAAIRAVTPATVVIVARAFPPGNGWIALPSSGVLVTRSGYVLSDGDPGACQRRTPDGRVESKFSDVVEVRIPDLKHATFQPYVAKVVRRVKEIDSSLTKIDAAPASGFPFVVPRTADDLRVGSFTFAMGTSFGHDEGGTAALTAGVVAALVRAPDGDPAGRFLEVYTSAAVNPGVNGGPLVDADGNLVGVISTWGQPVPDNPFQFLGKAFPIDRVRAAYKDLADAAAIFPDPKAVPAKSKQADLLETAFSLAAARVYPSIASLEVARSEAFEMKVPAPPNPEPVILPRYAGAVSGIVVSADGWIVTSLYNLGNVTSLSAPRIHPSLDENLSKITGITAHFPDGTTAPARLVANDQRLGLACVKADLPAGKTTVPAEAAPPEAARIGRMVVCVGNPFGATTRPDPLVTVGLISRFHPPDAGDVWRGNFQTDAGITDGNCGGAIVDVHGRILGLATLWNPAQQGRASGIGFGIPWDTVLAALPTLEAGTSFRYGNAFLGVGWNPAPGLGLRIESVGTGTPAEAAGLKAGDVVTAIDGKPVRTHLDARDLVTARQPGDTITLSVIREGKTLEIKATLGERKPGE